MYPFAPAQVVISGGPMQTGPLILRHMNLTWTGLTKHIIFQRLAHSTYPVKNWRCSGNDTKSGDIAHNYKWKMYCILFTYCFFPLSLLICTAWVYAKMLLKPLLNFPVILIRHNSHSIEASLI